MTASASHVVGTSRRRLAGGALTAFLALAACGEAGVPAPAARLRERVTIRWSVWGVDNSPMVRGFARGIEVFRQTHPYIDVVAEPRVSAPGGPTGQEKTLTGWIAGDGPDVSGSCCATLPDWGRQGLLLSLDSLLKHDGREVPLTDYVQAQLDVWRTPLRGQFALPMNMGVFGLFYSKTLFERKDVPFPDDTWDWDTWRDAMLRLTDKTEGTWGYMQSISFQRTGILIRQNGGSHVDPEDDRRAVFDSPQAVGALQWLHDRMWKDQALAKGGEITGSEGLRFRNYYTAVGAGKLGMLLDGSWILARWHGEQPDTAEQWDVAELPKGAAQRDGGATVDGWAIWNGSRHKLEAWHLLKFLQTDPWLEIATTVDGHQPSRKSWQDRYVSLMKKTYPALAGKNLDAFTKAVKGDYARPEQFWRQDAAAKKIWTDAVTTTFTKNAAPVPDTFRAAAHQVNLLNGK